MRRILFFLTVSFSSCCALTSSCNCDPPPTALVEESIAWINHYDNIEAITFIDSTGSIDSLILEKVSDTESCGGDECASECRRENINIISSNDSNLRFEIAITRNNLIRINQNGRLILDFTSNPVGWPNTLRLFAEGVSTSVSESYSWNNEITDVLHISCDANTTCLDASLKEITISEDFGFIQYIDSQDRVWTRTD